MTRTKIAIGIVLLVLVAIVVAWRCRGSEPELTAPSSASDSAATPPVPAPRILALGPHVEPSSALSGTVRAQGAETIAEATVCADLVRLEQGHERGPWCVTSTSGGRFSIEGLPRGEYELYASAPRYRPTRFQPSPTRTTIVLDAAQTRSDLVLVLRPGGVEVRGVVRDISGGAIEGARVRVTERASAGASAVATAQTDGDGHFVAWVGPGMVHAAVEVAGYAPNAIEGSAPGTELELYLTPESSLRGTVRRAETSELVAGIKVELTASNPVFGMWIVATTFTDARGAFSFDGLTPGSYKARAVGRELFGQGPTVHIGLIEAADPIVIEVSACLSITATVKVRETQQPCPGGDLKVRSDDGETTTVSLDSRGQALISPASPGRYLFAPECAGHLEDASYDPVIVDQRSVEVELGVSTGATVRGRVLDAQGQPLEAVRVSCRGLDEAGEGPTNIPRYAFSENAGTDGAYVLTGLAAGRHQIELFVSSRPAVEPVVVEVAAGQTLEGVDLVVGRGSEVTGVVQGPDGRPLADVRVALDPDDGFGDRIYTDAAGTFRFQEVTPGPGAITVSERRFRSKLRRVGEGAEASELVRYAVPRGGSTHVVVVVEPVDAQIEGIVVDPDGIGVSDAFVDLERESMEPGGDPNAAARALTTGFGRSPSLTDLSGEFSVSGIPEGTYTIRAFRQGGGMAILRGVRTGGRVELKIAQTGAIRGRVSGGDAGSVERLTIKLVERDTAQTIVDEFYRTDGQWAFEEVPPGHYRVHAFAAEGFGRTDVEVTAGRAAAGVEVELLPRVTVRGRIVDAQTQQPVADRRVAVLVRGESLMFGEATDGEGKDVTGEDGRFEVSSAPQGAVHVAVTKTNFGGYDPYGFMVFAPRIVEAGDGGVVEIGDIEIAKGLPSRRPAGDLGFHTASIDTEYGAEQARIEVSAVVEGGAAQDAGLQQGDIIVAVDGVDVRGARAYLYRDLVSVAAGETVSLTLADGRSVELRATEPT